ncbi:MAG: ArsR family transcriptional regulator [Desulfobacteraceae bacterium]|nr:MAG: ArsR family transcriptional regulator [Desulfobacteraceae bacterium]
MSNSKTDTTRFKMNPDTCCEAMRKTRQVSEFDVQRYSDIFKALSNPHRLRIFLRLVSCCGPGTVWTVEAQESASVGDLAKDLNIVPSTVSHHIKELRQAGLIKMRRAGQKIECWIDAEIYRELGEFFKS